MNLIGAASSAGAATMIVFSSAPFSASVSASCDDRRHALADGDVDADEVLVLVVDDRVDRDRRLAGLAVADDQLALAAADRDHRVDRLQAGLHRLGDRLALDDAGGLDLGRARLGGLDRRPCRRAGARAGRRCGPSRPSPTGMSSRWSVRLTVSPSTIFSQSPKSTTPTLSDSRFSARPVTPWGSSSISSERQFSRPWTRAMPSADRQDGADLGQLGRAGVEALDAALEDAGDLVGLDLHCEGWLLDGHGASSSDLLAKVARVGCGWRRRGWSSRRARRSRRGLRDRRCSSARRCALSGGRSRRRRAGRPTASSSTALVIWTGRSLLASSHSRSYSRRTRKITGMRWFSSSSVEEVDDRLVGAVTALSQAVLLLLGGEVGREEEHLQLARLVERVGELRRAARARRRACRAPVATSNSERA